MSPVCCLIRSDRWLSVALSAPYCAVAGTFCPGGRPDNVERISIALASLLDRSNEAWLELITAANAQGVWRQSGELHVYRTRQAWEDSRASDELADAAARFLRS